MVLGNQLTKADQLRTLDGVYYDDALGVAGTVWPIGTPGRPVNSIADAITIAQNRGYNKLYLCGTGVHTVTIPTNFNMQVVGNFAYTVTVAPAAVVYIGSDFDCLELVNTTGQIGVGGNLRSTFRLSNTTGAIAVEGNLFVDGDFNNTGVGSLTVSGNVYIRGTVTNSGGGAITVYGNIQTASSWNNAGGGDIAIRGKASIGGTLTINGAARWESQDLDVSIIYDTSTGAFTTYGKCRCTGTITNDNTGTMTIEGSLDILGSAVAAEGWLNNTGGGQVTVMGPVRCRYITNTTAVLLFLGDVYLYGSLTTTTGDVTIGGNAHIGDSLTATTGDINIYGNLYVRNATTVSGAAGLLHVYGDAKLMGAVGATNATAVITIDGQGYVYGVVTRTGTITYDNVAEAAEDHIHNKVRWYTKKNPQGANDWSAPLDGNLANPYRCISGNGTWGADANDEALLFGTADTLAELGAGMITGDADKILVTANSSATVYLIRVIWGTGTMADAIAAGQYTEFPYLRAALDNVRKIQEFKMPRVPTVGYKLWAQCQNATNNATIDFVIGVHAYGF